VAHSRDDGRRPGRPATRVHLPRPTTIAGPPLSRPAGARPRPGHLVGLAEKGGKISYGPEIGLDGATHGLDSDLLDLRVGVGLRLNRELVGKAATLGLPSFVVRGAECCSCWGSVKLIDSTLVIVLHNCEQEIERELASPADALRGALMMLARRGRLEVNEDRQCA
jgi:hypothetical protein